MVSILVGVAVLLTTIDPIQLTEYTLVFSAVALPLTYLPILVVANDRGYLGDRVNGRLANAVGVLYLVIVAGRGGRRDPADDHDPDGRWLTCCSAFDLLDRQIVDRDGEPVGKVDDVELAVDDDGVAVRGGAAGRPAGARPSGSAAGSAGWIATSRRRLRSRPRRRPDADPVRPGREVDSAVTPVGAAGTAAPTRRWRRGCATT